MKLGADQIIGKYYQDYRHLGVFSGVKVGERECSVLDLHRTINGCVSLHASRDHIYPLVDALMDRLVYLMKRVDKLEAKVDKLKEIVDG